MHSGPYIKSLQGHEFTLTQHYHQKSVRVFCPKSYVGKQCVYSMVKKESIITQSFNKSSYLVLYVCVYVQSCQSPPDSSVHEIL